MRERIMDIIHLFKHSNSLISLEHLYQDLVHHYLLGTCVLEEMMAKKVG